MFCYEYGRPIVTADVVLFTVKDVPVGRPGKGEPQQFEPRVMVALVPRDKEPCVGVPALPGVQLHTQDGGDWDLDACALRALDEKCGMRKVFLEQLKTYSGRDRDVRDWSVTTAYYALVPLHILEAGSKGIVLVEADGLSGLPFDHDRIVSDGLTRIRGKATYTTLPTKLLPDTFTFRELEEAYEAVLGRKVHTASFRRKMEDLTVRIGAREVAFLRKTGKKRMGGTKPAAIYAKATDDLIVFPQRF